MMGNGINTRSKGTGTPMMKHNRFSLRRLSGAALIAFMFSICAAALPASADQIKLDSSDIQAKPVDPKVVTDKVKIFQQLPGINKPPAEQNLTPATGPQNRPDEPTNTGTPDGKPNAVPPGPTTPVVTPDTTVNPGVLTVDPNSPDQIQKILKMRQQALKDPANQPKPEQLEAVYHNVWRMLASRYVDDAKLKDWDKWATKYDGKLKNVDDLNKALHEMVASVNDRWTHYSSIDDAVDQLTRMSSGIKQIGFGMARQDNGTYKIEMIMYGSPAWLSNQLRTGDVVKSITINTKDANGAVSSKTTNLAGLTKADADNLLLAPVGTEAVVTISHDGQEDQVHLAFAETPEAQIEVSMLPGDIGYIRLPSFGTSGDEVGELTQGTLEALFAIDQSAHGHLRGLVLDMRNNPGGVVDVAQQVASLFIRDGIFLKTHERNGRYTEDKTTYINAPKPYNFVGMPAELAGVLQRLYTVPLTVLVNGSSASSAEILTGTLKDNKRAVIIGTTTFGKAVAFTELPVKPIGQVQVTIMHYLTPSGYDLANKGITPDIVIDRSRGGKVDEQLAMAVMVIKQANAKLTNPSLPDAATGGDGTSHDGQAGGMEDSLLLIGVGLGLLLLAAYLTHLHHTIRNEREEKARKDRNKNRGQNPNQSDRK